MLHLRLSTTAARAPAVEEELSREVGLRRVTCVTGSAGDSVIEADLELRAADDAVVALAGLGVRDEDFVLSHIDVVAPAPAAQSRIGAETGFAWIEVLDEARTNARPFARYLVLTAVAAVIAAVGVIANNPILVIGAMAVSPDLLPLCAICVALVGQRASLARRASATLASGLASVAVIAAWFALILDLLGFLPPDFTAEGRGLEALVTTDYSTVLVALAAGVAAMLSFETRASPAVGVAISVTTIPASAYTGVAFAAGDLAAAGDSLLVLATNVGLLVLSGSATLAVQRWLARRSRGREGHWRRASGPEDSTLS